MVIRAKMFAVKLTNVRSLNGHSFLFERESGLMIVVFNIYSKPILKR